MLEFKLRTGVKVFKDKDTITLSVGTLENNIVSIEGEPQGDNGLMDAVKTIINDGVFRIERNTGCYDELITLYNLGMLYISDKEPTGKVYIINLDSHEIAKSMIRDGVEVIELSELLSESDVNSLLAMTNALEYSAIIKRLTERLSDVTTLYIKGGLCHRNKLLALNHIITKLKIKTIFFTYDTMSCFVIGVNSAIGTGCLNCFLRNLSNSKIIGNPLYRSDTLEVDESVESFLNSIMYSELNNLNVHHDSILIGNVITYVPGLYQYTFDFNRRTVLCENCTQDFYDSFEEQNVAAVNLVRGIERKNS